jgi:hypothetical protein
MTATADHSAGAEAGFPIPATGPTCVACEFIATSVRRRIFFTLVEGLGEFWFFRAMQSGGFCLRHARDVATGGAGALSSAYLDVTDGWLRRLGDHRAHHERDGAVSDLQVGGACYLCDTESWAEGFALDLLSREDTDYARAQLGQLEPLCLQHLDRLLGRIHWSRLPDVARQLGSRIEEAARTIDEPDAPGSVSLRIVAGRDPNDAVRAGPRLPAAGPTLPPDQVWAAGSITMAGLRAELSAGRCPSCTAARAATSNYLRWLADPGLGPDGFRDREMLCVDHLHDADAQAPLAARRSLTTSLEHWARTAGVLATIATPPPNRVGARIRGVFAVGASAWTTANGTRRLKASLGAVLDHAVRPGLAVDERRALARQQRSRPCVGCQAMSTAAARTIDLLGSLVAGPAGARFYEETNGLCLRHAAAAGQRFAKGERGLILAVARARALEVRWELEESIRKSSWSARYEPAGPERLAWQRALVAVLGEDILAADLFATEPERPRPAA